MPIVCLRPPGGVPPLSSRDFGRKEFCMPLFACLLLLLTAGGLYAQVLSNGSFLGTVKDQTGASVPGASVRIFRLGTELQRQKTTDAEGNYQLLDITVGE